MVEPDLHSAPRRRHTGQRIFRAGFAPLVRFNRRRKRMRDLTDAELIEFVAGLGSPGDRARIEAELESSSDLKARYDAIAGVWRLLGEGDEAAEPRDLWGDVAAQLPRDARPEQHAGRRGIPWWLSAAAAVLIAFGAGHIGGRLHLSQASQPVAAQVVATPDTAPTDEQIAKEMGLAAFDQGAVRSFVRTLVPDSDPPGVEENQG
jgi:anti-sigma factor RsiW